MSIVRGPEADTVLKRHDLARGFEFHRDGYTYKILDIVLKRREYFIWAKRYSDESYWYFTPEQVKCYRETWRHTEKTVYIDHH